jgi:hypothetical protein
MITYNFNIVQLEIAPLLNGLEKVVTRIQYSYTGTENELSTTIPGGVDMPQPLPENFKSFDTLTEQEVVTWLESVVDTDILKVVIGNSIEEKKTPKHVPVTSPWITTTTTTTEAPVVTPVEETTTTTEAPVVTPVEETTTTTTEAPIV